MAEKEREEEGSTIKVTDKRRFTEEGGRRESAEKKGAPARPERPADVESDPPVRPIDFPTFVLSLASSVQVHLGIVPNPGTGKPEKDLALARQTIDVIGILQEKTRGNLSKAASRI